MHASSSHGLVWTKRTSLLRYSALPLLHHGDGRMQSVRFLQGRVEFGPCFVSKPDGSSGGWSRGVLFPDMMVRHLGSV